MSDPVLRATATAVAAGVPVLIWGGPGVGKTSGITAIAHAAGLPFEAVIASIREPSDFAGLPVVSEQGVRFAPPDWARRLADAGRGILLLDELSTAPPAVQAALLRVVFERCVGDLRLPDAVRVVAAANPPDEAADGWDLAAPLANRFCHLDWQLDAARWTAGFATGFETPDLAMPDASQLAVQELRARSDVASFVRARPQFLYQLPRSDTGASRAWPSPRSWELAAKCLAAAALGQRDAMVESLLVGGCVGGSAGGEFLAWRDSLALPDPEDVLRDPESFVLPDRTDRAFAALSAVTAAVVGNCTAERWVAAWRALMAAMRADQPDLAVVAARTLLKHRPTGALPPREVLTEMASVLREAGLFDAITGRTPS